MLNISPGSTCDICLEPYGRDAKVPTSVLCGHIFCSECINSLRATNAHPFAPELDLGAPCPLCRTRFDSKSTTRLHIDFGDSRGSSSPPRPGATSVEADAKRFQDAFTALTREGITEQGLRQLLDDARTFLSAQPRDQFADLRVLHRVIAYLCETKSKLRDERLNHDKELIRLQDEKDALERQLNELAAKRRDDRHAAMKTEEELRVYCKSLQGAYESMIRHYNFLVDEWQKLTEDNERLRAKQYEALHVSPTAGPISSPEVSPSTLLDSRREHADRLRGTAIFDPETFSISPLPQFTSMLPSISSLPALDDDVEYVRETKPKHSSSSLLSERARDHLANSNPPRFEGSSSAPSSISMTSGLRSSTESRDRDPTRVHQSSSRSGRRSQPPSPLGGLRPIGEERHSQIMADASILSPPISSSPPNHGPGLMNNRLQDLLQDTPVTTSSSLPNMSHFPASLTPESHRSREKDKSHKSRSPSRSRPTTLPSPHAKQDREVHPAPEPLPSSEPVPNRAKPPVPDLSSGPISTASMAAQAAEKAKQERRRAEQEAERERRKIEKDRAEEDGRRRFESERVRAPPAPGTSPSSGTMGSAVSHPPSSYPQNYTASSTYASQRTSAGSLGRSATNPYNADKSTKAIPIPGRV